ncbi:antibiotic biosynthesis monooxygenase [Dasania marina]|uniref:antibiotic biosynthesis monooxygenase family protein n=1 Tax=Dasania marina TaxID=471499 RepID=UPI0030DBA996|tara:strand:+ start:7712 stop:8005 length:294 start_codon:yes stop_codon:yes gene_type:complete
MYAVIFKAEVAEFDEEYFATAAKMRDTAINQYGCRDFIACSEGNMEIAISYWDSEAQIKAWKQDLDHIAAQQLGKAKWYKSYTVEITEIVRAYHSQQ